MVSNFLVVEDLVPPTEKTEKTLDFVSDYEVDLPWELSREFDEIEFDAFLRFDCCCSNYHLTTKA
jgi:hypothetical protein